ncbi:dihydrodipicolinate reductase [Lacimonas salitolerans]|uniref:Dihydrodipicolinate reductase n=1 Tax=Lacimonas salitolerans TaxID=1323750 RepID=A0ABW4EGW9_9RHOB
MIRMISICIGLLLAVPAWAEEFQTVRDRGTFLSIVQDRNLNIPFWGIRLEVQPDGRIRGEALGRPVSGMWQWQGDYFCRDLMWGERDLGANCQEVKVQGQTVRFTSDRGEGRFADLTLR